MAKTKTKKQIFKKAKKVGLTSSLVWMLLFVLLFDILMGLVAALYTANIAGNKWDDNKRIVEAVARQVGDLEYEDAYLRNSYIRLAKEANPEIAGMGLLSESGEYLDDFETGMPLPNELHPVGDMAFGKYVLGANNVYIRSEDMELIQQEKNLLSMNLFHQALTTLRSSFRMRGDRSIEAWLSDEVVGFDLWYTFPYGDTANTLLVHGHISLQSDDFAYLIAVFIIISFLFVLMMAYYIFTVIRAFVNKRRIFNLLYADTETSGRNKLYFEERGRYLIRRKYKKEESLFFNKETGNYEYAVVCLTFVHYKAYIATKGAEHFQTVLETFYQILRSNTNSKKELVIHHDKGSFALLLLYHSESEMNERISRMIDLLAQAEKGEKMGFLAGVSHLLTPSDEPADLYNNAVIARSKVVEGSDCQIAWFTEEMHVAQLWGRKVENEMESALETGQFVMYLQPKYGPVNRTLGGAEALCRWAHPSEGLIPPGRFIPIFEENGFILKLDDFMIEEVAKAQGRWLKEGKELVPISVNVSRAHFTMPDLAEHIRDIVDKYQVPHDKVELEITESAFFEDKGQLLKTLNKMSEYGFPISMDDFGAGYSSLNSLKEMPLNVVKLDAEFFRGEEGEKSHIIVQDTIALAKRLGLHIVAEGIEAEEQVEFLADLSCDLIQGYFFAKPMPVESFEQEAYTRVVTIENI